ncbi:hypothetical protein KL905_003971 [Ogataea polymorpha]|uniref:uncharacterized protein n=1 Tax=Ogataea polymorpha TaxID=460523 RepID=UPI0007F3638F|nr:uncharacterized protein OGAPODRAFT_49884 [Ogataea polymorpha]KAG7918960.1 hypothetical protein KL905_003971 [Ogataea polymorpha]KAG7931077.1 hypothetical protein KL934_004198 [Ogataea polymorpha]OBA15328.1 hypothetical protein OGAPODRAFT_49884 [Ogataea polymorpha]
MSATETVTTLTLEPTSTKSVRTYKDAPGIVVTKTKSVPNELIEAASATLYLHPHGDWRDQLIRDGYAVIKAAIPKQKAREYQQKAFGWMKSFGNDRLDFLDPETWKKENLPPVDVNINVYNCYGVTHEKFMWDARMEPGVLGAFEKLWNTDQLLASFDGLNVTLPNRKDAQRKSPWPHFDQSPYKAGLHCVQGIISLSDHGPEDGGLVVYKGSHNLFNEFFSTQIRKEDWDEFNYYQLSDEQLQWFLDHGCEEVKVNCEAGDLVVWDSRTCHWGMEPTEKSNTVRTVIYSCFTPAKFASEEALSKKKELFENFSGTTHWPHADLTAVRNPTHTNVERTGPLEKPVMTDKLLKLAGAKPY